MQQMGMPGLTLPQPTIPQFAIGPDGQLKLLTQEQIVNFFNSQSAANASAAKSSSQITGSGTGNVAGVQSKTSIGQKNNNQRRSCERTGSSERSNKRDWQGSITECQQKGQVFAEEQLKNGRRHCHS